MFIENLARLIIILMLGMFMITIRAKDVVYVYKERFSSRSKNIHY
jgi:hypothetical protein